MSNESLSPRVLAPLEFRQAEDSVRFAPMSAGQVGAVPVLAAGGHVGWLWFDDEARAAGWVTNFAGPSAPTGLVLAWTVLWERVAQAGAKPSEVRRFVEVSELSLGQPAWDAQGFTTLTAMWDTGVRPPRAPLPQVAPLAVEALAGGSVSGPALDAALRGQLPMSEAMAQQVATLDEVLQRKPVPEPMVVARGTSLKPWAGEPEALAGERFVERAFFAARLGPVEPEGIDAVVHLAVPAGVPALYTAPPEAPERGVLILARALVWSVERVDQAPSGTWVISASVG